MEPVILLALVLINLWTVTKSFDFYGAEAICYLTIIAEILTLIYYILRFLGIDQLQLFLSFVFSLQFTVTVMFWTIIYPSEGISEDPLQNVLTHGGLLVALSFDIIRLNEPLKVWWTPTIFLAIAYSAFLYYYTTRVHPLYTIITFQDWMSWVYVITPNFVHLIGVYSSRILITGKEKKS